MKERVRGEMAAVMDTGVSDGGKDRQRWRQSPRECSGLDAADRSRPSDALTRSALARARAAAVHRLCSACAQPRPLPPVLLAEAVGVADGARATERAGSGAQLQRRADPRPSRLPASRARCAPRTCDPSSAVGMPRSNTEAARLWHARRSVRQGAAGMRGRIEPADGTLTLDPRRLARGALACSLHAHRRASVRPRCALVRSRARGRSPTRVAAFGCALCTGLQLQSSPLIRLLNRLQTP